MTKDNPNLQFNGENEFLKSLKNQDYFSYKEITVEDVPSIKNLAVDEFSSDLVESIAPVKANFPTELTELEDLSSTVDEGISNSNLIQSLSLSTYDSVFSKNLNQRLFPNNLSNNNDSTSHNATPSCCGCSSCLGLASNNNGSANQGTVPQAAANYTDGFGALLAGPWWDSQTITFSFMTRVPDYYYSNDMERNQFTPFNETQKAGARRALQLFSEVSGLKFVEVSDGGQGGTIRFGTAGLQNAAAHAYFPMSNPKGGDVWLNNNYNENLNQSDGSYGFLTMIHEIGHALGLKHPGNYNASGGAANGPFLYSELDHNQYTVMSYHNHQGSIAHPDTLMPYDIEAIQSLYGANYDTRSEDTTYAWNENQIFVETIWDGGGTDTIDASNQILSATINLNSQAFSSIGYGSQNSRAVNNLAIASGVTIENAVGGSGNDILIGNNVSNILVGGSGNDTLTGGSGYDVLAGGDGNDTFVLGTSTGVFYQGDEYARITDFNSHYDLIQLTGTANQYSLEIANWFGSDALDTAIFLGDDAIAVVQDTTDSNYSNFIFV